MKQFTVFVAASLWILSFLAFVHERSAHHDDSTGKMSVSEQMVDEKCTLDGVTPDVIATGRSDITEWHGRFTFSYAPYLLEPSEPSEQIEDFRDAVGERIGTDIDSRELTKRQHDFFVTLPDEWSRESANSALLLDGHAGTITDMSCLEMMLWEWQDARYPMLDHPTEFGAFVLRGDERVRIYLSSADLVGLKVNQEVTEQVRIDILAGYRLITHIHNHPFLFDREVGDRMWTTEATIKEIAGGLAPSMSDVGFYRSFHDSHGLEEAWITNGLQSSRFTATEFEMLTAR